MGVRFVGAQWTAVLAALLGGIGFGGCRNARSGAEGTALVTGVAVMTAASPAIPVVDAVRHLSGADARRERAYADLAARLDPVYRERIAALQARDPVADAYQLHQLGHHVFLAWWPGGAHYPGLAPADHEVVRTLATQVTAEPPALWLEVRHLTDLQAPDLHPAPEEKLRYGGDLRDAYSKAVSDYSTAFNRTLLHALTAAK